MRTPRSLIGKRFGRLTVTSRWPGQDRQRVWLARCDCGTFGRAEEPQFLSGRVVSCGCWRGQLEEPLGQETPEHRSWRGMFTRCYDPKCWDYQYYGARGIGVSKEWHSFHNFLRDMGLKPSRGHTLERIDNDGPYSPENCRWATRREQANNRSWHRATPAGARVAEPVARSAESDDWPSLKRTPNERVLELRGIMIGCAEAARIIGIGRNQMWRIARSGKISCTIVGTLTGDLITKVKAVGPTCLELANRLPDDWRCQTITVGGCNLTPTHFERNRLFFDDFQSFEAIQPGTQVIVPEGRPERPKYKFRREVVEAYARQRRASQMWPLSTTVKSVLDYLLEPYASSASR